MNLIQAYRYLGKLLEAGIPPEVPLAAMSNGWPCEIADAVLLSGDYKGDPYPKMSAFALRTGPVLALVPIGEDPSDLANEGTHSSSAPPVEFPANAPENA